MKFCRTCGLWPQVIEEEERLLQIELMMDAALAASADPLVYYFAWSRARFSAPPAILAHWALARWFLRLQKGVALYEAMPAKLRAA